MDGSPPVSIGCTVAKDVFIGVAKAVIEDMVEDIVVDMVVDIMINGVLLFISLSFLGQVKTFSVPLNSSQASYKLFPRILAMYRGCKSHNIGIIPQYKYGDYESKWNVFGAVFQELTTSLPNTLVDKIAAIPTLATMTSTLRVVFAGYLCGFPRNAKHILVCW